MQYAIIGEIAQSVHLKPKAGEGLFMTRLTGPERILLQTLKRRQSGRQQ